MNYDIKYVILHMKYECYDTKYLIGKLINE